MPIKTTHRPCLSTVAVFGNGHRLSGQPVARVVLDLGTGSAHVTVARIFVDPDHRLDSGLVAVEYCDCLRTSTDSSALKIESSHFLDNQL